VKSRTTTIAVAAGLGLTTILGLTATASAQEPSDEPALVGDGCVPDARIEAARTRILRGIDNRLQRVDRLQAAVAATDTLTDAHHATIDGTLAGDESGLTALRATVAGEVDGCALADEGRSVVDDFRIYVVVTPQTRLALGGDRVAGAADRIDQLEQRMSDAIAAAEADGQDVSDAQAAFDVFVAEAGSAIDSATPVGDAVLALSPADWPDTARPVLEDGRADLRSSVEHLRTARAAAQDVRDALHD
jgi:hypothetical protein